MHHDCPLVSPTYDDEVFRPMPVFKIAFLNRIIEIYLEPIGPFTKKAGWAFCLFRGSNFIPNDNYCHFLTQRFLNTIQTIRIDGKLAVIHKEKLPHPLNHSLKEQIDHLIQQAFPDTKDVEFRLDGKSVKTWVETRLWPFLFYQNTRSKKNHIVNLFFDENAISKKLLPAYFAVSSYKRTIKNVLSRLNYQVQFPPNSIQLVHKGSVSYLTSIDYLNKVINIKNGMGATTHLKFDEYYQLRWPYARSKTVQKQIETFRDLKNAEDDDFFNFPIEPTKSEFEGVICFTSKTSFLRSLRQIEINGCSITSSIHVEELIYHRDTDSYEFRSISSKDSIKKKPVSLLIASHEDIFAFENIKQFGGEKLAHLKTIIVDDFDDRLLKARADSEENVIDLLQRVNDNLLNQIKTNSLHTIYFVNKSYNYPEAQSSWASSDTDQKPTNWILKPTDVVELNSFEINPIIKLTCKNLSSLETLLSELRDLCDKWKSLVSQYFCNGETAKGLFRIYWLIKTLDGVYSPSRLKGELSNFIVFLDDFLKNYFANRADNGLIVKTIEFVSKVINLKDAELNHKLSCIIDKLDQGEPEPSIAIVNSFSPTPDDVEYVLKQIKTVRHGAKATIVGPKEGLSVALKSDDNLTECFILLFSGKWRHIPFLTLIGKKVELILNQKSYEYARSYVPLTIKRINSIEGWQEKARFLDVGSLEFNTPETQVVFDEPEGQQSKIPEAVIQIDDSNFQQILKSLNLSWKASDNVVEDGPKVCVLTDDGSSYTWNESKKIFTYSEGHKSIDDCFQYAKDLTEGSKIILLKQDYRQNTNIKKTIEDILSSTNDYAATLEYYNEWRKIISGKIEIYSGDYARFASSLKESGFETTPHTISNWIDGTTTYPQNFALLLKTLTEMGIIQQAKASKYLTAVKTVKSLQITFIREALKKLLSDIEGIDYLTENVAINENVINSFIDKIEVKRIENVLLESYAD